MQILIDGPKTIVLAPQHLATVLDCLSNAPFKVADPIIRSIFQQIQAQDKPVEEELKTNDGQGTD